MPLIKVFGPYLFEASRNDEFVNMFDFYLYISTRSAGTSLAFGGLCRLICRTYPALPLTLLSHFYTALRRVENQFLLFNQKRD